MEDSIREENWWLVHCEVTSGRETAHIAWKRPNRQSEIVKIGPLTDRQEHNKRGKQPAGASQVTGIDDMEKDQYETLIEIPNAFIQIAM